LIENKANVNQKDAWGDTPLHKSVVNGHTEAAKILLEAKADINALVLQKKKKIIYLKFFVIFIFIEFR
jgi:ankyrin repeat protein